jgi:hypothetical protein
MGLQRAGGDGREGTRHASVTFFFDLIFFEALSSMPVSSYLPREEEARDLGRLADPDVPVEILPVNGADDVWSGVDPEAALNALASNKNTLEATAMDSETLRKCLSTPWTAESAFKDCASSWNVPCAIPHRFVDSHGTAVKLRPFTARWHVCPLETCTYFDAHRKFVAAEFSSLDKRSWSHRSARRA